MTKIQVTLPEWGNHPTKIIDIEVDQTEHGPVILLKSLLGETLDSISIHRLLYSGQSMEELLDHECETDECDEKHCSDGNCMRIDKSEVDDKIEELKHKFHELENLLDP